MSYKRISFEVKENIGYIGFGYNCDKSMTVLDEETLTELQSAVEELHQKGKELKGAIFFSHKDKCFLAGADINLISAMSTEGDGVKGAEAGQQIFNRIEDLKCPTIACVHGVCLGGGMELSLSCNHIVASDSKSTAMGLPEVKLGLIPGFGGTYRMPKKIGLPKALDLILTGKMVKSKKGKRLGLVSGIYPKERLLTMAETHFKDDGKKKSFKESIGDIDRKSVV